MTTEKFVEDVQQAHLELKGAMAEVMVLVNAGKAFGANWHAAIERERKAHEVIQRLFDMPLSQAVLNRKMPIIQRPPDSRK